MAATTPFTIGAGASCTDGACGKVTQVVVDPVARAVTHLVVDRHGKARLVPLDLVGATGDEIRLRCTRAEFQELGLAETKQFLPVSGSGADLGYGPDQMNWPYYGLGGRGPLGIPGPGLRREVIHDSVPAGEVAVRRGQHVQASDGTIGQVQGLVIDPASRQVTHVLLQEGHLWGRKEVAIPIGAVTGVEAGVQLSITRQQVENLPPVDIDHPGG